MTKLMFRRVKEGINRVSDKRAVAGLFVALLPFSFISPQPTVAPVTPQPVWQTKLVLADNSPDLLTSSDQPVQFEIVPSRYQEEQKQLEEKRKALEAAREAELAKAAAQAGANTTSVAQSTTSCAADLSDSQKWDLISQAAQAYGIPPKLLGAVWQIESGKRTCTSVKSYAGAAGPLQFMQGTWRKYAVDGNGDGVANIYDARDALYGAAKLLAANGAAEGNYARALLSYNHAQWYVNKVLSMAQI